MRILFQTAIARFTIAELTLQDAKDMFDPGACFRFVAIGRFLLFTQRLISIRSLLGKVTGIRSGRIDDLLLPGISRDTPHSGFVAMQQILQHLRVVTVG